MKHKYLIGLYDDEVPLIAGAKKLRKAGFRMKEVYTPFPVHGIDEAMGIQDTRLHTIGFVFGAIGTLFALGLMTFVSALDWPINVGGKPFFALPSFIPITFELTVLFASIGMVVVYYIRNGFSVFKDPEIIDPRVTDDRFAMVFCMKKYGQKQDQIAQLLEESGVVEVKERYLEEELPDNLFVTDEVYFENLKNAHH